MTNLVSRIFDEREAELSKLVQLLEIRQEPTESFSQFLARIRVEAYKMMGDIDKIQNDKFILSSFMHDIRDESVGKMIETMKPELSEEALIITKRAETKVIKVDFLRIIVDQNDATDVVKVTICQN